MVINTLVNEVEELICANACSDRCIDVARYFECKHPCCIKTALMLDWCIQCGCDNKYKEKVRLIEFSVHKRCLSDNYVKTCLKAWNASARMAKYVFRREAPRFRNSWLYSPRTGFETEREQT